MKQVKDVFGVKPIYIFLVIALIFGLLINFRIDVLDWDALAYVMNGQAFRGESTYYEWHRPFLLPFLIFLFGGTELVARLISVSLFLLAIYAVYLLAKELFDEETALYSSIVFTIIPLVQYWAVRVYTSVPMIALGALGFYFLVKHDKTNDNRFLYLFFIFSALTYLMRYVGLMFLFVGLIYLVIAKKISFKIKKEYVFHLVLGLLVFSAIITPWLLFNYINTGDPFYSPSIAKAQMDRIPKGSLMYYFQTWNETFTYPLTLFVLISFYFFFKKWNFKKLKSIFKTIHKERHYLLAFGIFLSFFIYFEFMLNLKSTRYLIPCMFGWALLSGDGIRVTREKLSKSFKMKKIKSNQIYATLVVLLLLVFVGSSYYHWTNIRKCQGVRELGDFLSELEGNAVSPIWPHFNYFSNMDVKWVPEHYETLLEETQTLNIKYLIFFTRPIEPDWAYVEFIDEKEEDWDKIKVMQTCLGEAHIYEYKHETSGYIEQEVTDIISERNFIPLKPLFLFS